ncbi:hypothetical protein FA13DRAFT_1093426 [Coprinellus micaceus]|uniref:Uncharacterized protein n=1 Tax=Coprinellus micaceus TaxID=71717 RepID=A0A4Y7TSZ6_COPMI|nr:hypothetical protein FA13DRAFT_1093426 [Coprinellus micaceus]
MSFNTSSRIISVSTLLLAATLVVSGIPISITPLELEHLYVRGPTCNPVNLQDIQKLPAWSKVVQYAEEHWGSGGGPKVNPPEYPERGVDACMNVATIQAQWAEQPTCEVIAGGQEGKVTNAELTASWKATIGTSSKASWSVTHASEVTVGAEYSISAQVPTIAQFSSKITFSGTVRNERSSSFEATNDQMLEQTFEYKNVEGKQCNFKVDTNVCKATASAQVPVVLDGRVWFYYGEARKDKVTGEPDGHYHWNVNLAQVLSEAERTTYIEIKGPVNAQSRTAYALNCDPINAAAKKVTRRASPLPSKATMKGKPQGSKDVKSPSVGKPSAVKPKAPSRQRSRRSPASHRR